MKNQEKPRETEQTCATCLTCTKLDTELCDGLGVTDQPDGFLENHSCFVDKTLAPDWYYENQRKNEENQEKLSTEELVDALLEGAVVFEDWSPCLTARLSFPEKGKLYLEFETGQRFVVSVQEVK